MEDFLGRRKSRNMVAGASSVKKAILRGEVEKLSVAKDAEEKITGPIVKLALEKGLEIEWVSSMKELGESMGLRVGASVVALLKTPG